ncbi:MAG: hypothetical protein ACI9DC_000079 [Gammaproteobacteria bacterium]
MARRTDPFDDLTALAIGQIGRLGLRDADKKNQRSARKCAHRQHHEFRHGERSVKVSKKSKSGLLQSLLIRLASDPKQSHGQAFSPIKNKTHSCNRTTINER